MKKILSATLVFLLIVFLTSCDTSQSSSKGSNSKVKKNNTLQQSTEAHKFRETKVIVSGEMSNLNLVLSEWNGADIIGNRSPIACEWDLTYDSNNNILSKKCVSKDGKTTCDIYYTYDKSNNVLSETVKTNGKVILKTTNSYFENGDIKTKNQKLDTGRKAKTTYDKHGNILLNVITDSEGRTTSNEYKYTYDNKGNILKCINISKSHYYASGKEITTSVYTYDKDGNKLTLDCKIDNGSNVRSYSKKWEYDTNGNLIHFTSTADEIKESIYKYNSIGKKVYQKDIYVLNDKVRIQTWEYNTKGKVTVVKEDGVESASYTYDASGNLITLKQDSETTSYQYYDNGKIKNKTIETELNKQSWNYDKNDNLIKYTSEEWKYAREKYKVVFKYEEI